MEFNIMDMNRYNTRYLTTLY